MEPTLFQYILSYIIFNIFPFIILLGLLILIHEFGHFIVAKLSGIKVEKFSLGFPPKLFSKKIGETEYIVSLLPLGGYVKLAGEENWVNPSADYEFHSKHPLIKISVVFAGPLMNFILAIILFFIVNLIGTEILYNPATPGKIGRIAINSAAEEIGLREGDEILEVNGKKIKSWNELFELSFLPDKSDKYLLTIKRDNQIFQKYITPKKINDRRIMGITQFITPEIGDIDSKSSAYKSGLKKGDKILEIDNFPITQWYDIEEYFLMNPEKEVKIKYQSIDGKIQTINYIVPFKTIKSGVLEIKPKIIINDYKKIYYSTIIEEIKENSIAERIGLLKNDKIIKIDENFTPQNFIDIITYLIDKANKSVKLQILRNNEIITKEVLIEEMELKLGTLEFNPKVYIEKYGIIQSFNVAIYNSIKYVKQTYDVLYRLITKQISPMNAMGGPISLFKFSGLAAQSGFTKFLLLIAIISVNLAVINLFPVPVLDGGIILFFLYELIFKRKLSEKIVEKGQQIGWALIIFLAIFVIYIDIMREFIK
ncbi:MAG TPA: RIP metalloprotease RseP [bacterium]|nr:RIP metalloprotease RseP [bacterium]HOL48655.1 RIP metalloprotease RseP [bacterium]HPQ19902.1 RIP metalloprotease RseP [bacterium]